MSTKKALPRDRTWFLIVFLIALAIFTATEPGRMIFDTKLGVDISTKEFLVRLWAQWNPLEWFGSLQDQYIGYAIPMAPFFLAGQLLHVPIWLIERTWLALLVAVGFMGLLKLARALQVGSDAARLVAAAVYVLWPTFTIVLGSTSAAALPGLIVPWAVLPLVPAIQGRSREGQAVARSGLAIAAMGGVNAVSTLAVLVLPALYIVTHTRHRQRRRLSLKWGIAVFAATAWWLIPLLLQGHYSFNFLPYIEQSSTTTRTMSAAAVLRGTGTWTAYFDLSGTPWLSAGWAMVTSAAAILASAVAAAVGLAGLAMRHMPERRWLCLTVGLAAAAALSGYYGPLGGALHTPIGHLLDGPLAPIRSMYKLEPTIAVALALGCAHALSRCWRVTVPLGRSVKVTASAATAPLVALTLAGLALPQLTGQVLQPGSFSSIPAYWHQAAAYLAVHSPRQTALVVPADPHGQFTWGETIDDPLEPLATSPWVERGLVPYGGAGSQIFLQTAEQAVESGQQVAGLPEYLARAGIRYVVVRNDVLPGTAGYTPPQVVNETMALSGFRMAAAFGPMVAASPDYPNVAGLRPGLSLGYPAVEIFAAANSAVLPASPVETQPVAQTVLVNGGPDSLLQLIGQGALGNQPAVIAGDKLAGRPALWAVTDGQRRADNDFGATSNYQSFTYTASEKNPPVDPLGGAGGPPRQLLPVQASGHQTVAVLAGARSITASSAGTWLAESMQYAPANAFDGNAATAWAESDPATPIGQWIQINFTHSVNLPASIGIRLLDDSAARSIANQLRVSTAAGGAVTNTITTGATQRLRVPPGRSTWLRITITGANNVITGLPGAGISDVLIPGIKVTSYLRPAEDPAGTRAVAVDYSFGQRVSSPYLHGQPNQQASQNLDRTFVTPSAAQLKVRLTAVPNPGTALESLIARLTPTRQAQFQVSASSTWDSLPELGPANLFARNPMLPWLAAATDPQPQLKISWERARIIRKIVVQPANGLAAAPTGVLIGSPAGDRLADVGLGGIVTVSPPLRTNTLYLNFAGESSAPGDTTSGQPAQLPLGLARLTIPALSHMHVATPSDNTGFQLSCGQGPSVAVNGHTYQTSVSGSVGDLVGLAPVKLSLCTPGEALSLAAGRQRLSAVPSPEFTITDVNLASQAVAGSTAESAQSRPVHVATWRADSREVKIGPGAASYLEIHENFNSGWTATLDGKALTPATLDGWQQAFIVPAGNGGTVTLTFAPAATYHVGVIAAAIALVALLAVAAGMRPRWRRRRSPGEPESNGTESNGTKSNGTKSNGTESNGTKSNDAGNDDLHDARFAATGNKLPAPPVGRPPGRHLGNRHTSWSAIISPHGMSGHGGRHRQVKAPVGSSFITLMWRSPRPKTRAEVARGALPYLPILSVILLAGGPIAVAVPVLAVIERLRQRWLPAIAFASMLAAGVISATARTPTNLGSGPFSAAAQVCALFALAAALTPAHLRKAGRIAPQAGKMTRPAAGGQHDVPTRQRFTAIDELACHFDTADEPFNIHLEMRLPGRLDEQAFRMAVNAAMLANRRTSSRRARVSPLGTRYTWEPASQLDVDPVSFSTVADAAELDRTRIAFISRSPSIDSSPAAMLLVASGPEVDHVILNAHHAAMDGLSWLELLRDIGRQYRAIVTSSDTRAKSSASASAARTTVPDAASGPPGIDPVIAHGEDPTAAMGMLGPVLSKVLRKLPLKRWPARICADGGSQRGYGLQMMQLPAVPVVPEFSTGGKATLNEVLITALIATIGRWNHEHDRPARWIRITAPANARAPGEPHASGNLSRLVTISAMPPSPRSDLGPLLADVARQARRARQDAAPQIGVAGRVLAGTPCPTAVKRLAVQIALRTAGRFVCDTAMLTNLGNVTDPPDFGFEGPVTMAFSAQAQMPRGLTVGVITAGGKLQLTLRYSRALLSDSAAGKLGQQFMQALAQLAKIGGDGEPAQRVPGSYSQTAGTAGQS